MELCNVFSFNSSFFVIEASYYSLGDSGNASYVTRMSDIVSNICTIRLR
jgi:hypothetical protein